MASQVENPNAPNPNGSTPLKIAVQYGNTEIFTFLAPQVENPNAPGPDGWTPIHLAARNGHTEIVKFILIVSCSFMESKVDNLNAPTPNYGRTPLQMAMQNGHKNIARMIASVVYPNAKKEMFQLINQWKN